MLRKAEDAGRLAPAKNDNAVVRKSPPQDTYAFDSDGLLVVEYRLVTISIFIERTRSVYEKINHSN